MAREITGNMLEGNLEHKTRQGVIWLRGYDHDPGTTEAQLDAISTYDCRQTILKNELYYEGYVDPVDVCFTDDPQIRRDYEAQGIKVVALRPLTKKEMEARKPKNLIQSATVEDENAALREQLRNLADIQTQFFAGQMQAAEFAATGTVHQKPATFQQEKAPEESKTS